MKHIVLMDPVDRTAFEFENGSLVRREFTAFDVPERGSLPFDSAQFFSELNQNLNEDGSL